MLTVRLPSTPPIGGVDGRRTVSIANHRHRSRKSHYAEPAVQLRQSRPCHGIKPGNTTRRDQQNYGYEVEGESRRAETRRRRSRGSRGRDHANFDSRLTASFSTTFANAPVAIGTRQLPRNATS